MITSIGNGKICVRAEEIAAVMVDVADGVEQVVILLRNRDGRIVYRQTDPTSESPQTTYDTLRRAMEASDLSHRS